MRILNDQYLTRPTLRQTFARDHIYFDGLLPPNKKPVRIKRLEACLKQTVAYGAVKQASLTSSEMDYIKKPLEISSADLFSSHGPPSQSAKALPAVPFLVPAVLDVLSASRYAEITRVVGGEADVSCAYAVYRRGCLVLTSDSDLLVYDLGSDGAVAFLSDLELQQVDDIECLSARVFRPGQIAKRLEIESVARLAYELTEHAPIAFGEALERARRTLEKDGSNAFRNFAREYVALDLTPRPDRIRTMNQLNTKPTFLDPRVSELVLQSLDLREKQCADMYLPFLIEDTSRISAWASSATFRHFVYSLLLKSGNGVYEYVRKGIRIRPEKFEAWSPARTLQFAEKFLNKVQRAMAAFQDVPQPLAWKMLCVAEILRWHLNTARRLPSVHAVEKIFGGISDGLRSNSAFLWAQVQGYCYSVRMLQQISNRSMLGIPEDSMDSVKKLSINIAGLPQLRVLLASPSEGVGRQDTKTQIDMILLFLAQEQSTQETAYFREWADVGQEKSRTRKEKAGRTDRNRKAQVETSNNNNNKDNRYGLLANA